MKLYTRSAKICDSANLDRFRTADRRYVFCFFHSAPTKTAAESRDLRLEYYRALRRVFILCDHDMDGALNDEELNEFQGKCFNAPMQPAEIMGVERAVQVGVEALYSVL